MTTEKRNVLDKGSAEPVEPIESEKKPSVFDKPIFRLATVFVYLGGISGLGFILAVYFLFFWDSSMPPVPVVRPTILQSRT